MMAAAGGGRSDSTTLQGLIDRAGALPPAAALLMLDDVLQRLGRIHAAGSTHAELQPSVILVDRFGRCNVGLPGAHGIATGAGVSRYQAPEVRGGGPLDPRADVYAATAIFAEALTGLAPDAARDLLTAPPGSVPTPLPATPAPPPMRRLVEAALVPDPARRPAGAADLRALLAEVAEASFPAEDWRSRGRSWLAAGVPVREPQAEPVRHDGRIESAPAYIPSWLSKLAPGMAPRPGSPPMPGFAAPAASATPPAETVPRLMPDWASGPAPPWAQGGGDGSVAPGFFTRMAHGDARVLGGFGAAVIGLLLLIIGASVSGSLSGPRTAAATQPPAVATPSDTGTATPPAFGSEFVPAPQPSATPSPSATPTPLPTAVPAPTPLPPNDNSTSFFPEPTFTPEPTAAPTPPPPPACLLICP